MEIGRFTIGGPATSSTVKPSGTESVWVGNLNAAILVSVADGASAAARAGAAAAFRAGVPAGREQPESVTMTKAEQRAAESFMGTRHAG